MKLVYTDNPARAVKVGDVVTLRDGEQVRVSYFRPPHKPSSSGRVNVHNVATPQAVREYYVGVIGAEWIEREDQQ
jgi:hypothetical protein